MAKFKVCFSGFAYINADDADEAQEKFNDEDFAYLEHEITECKEVDEFIVTV